MPSLGSLGSVSEDEGSQDDEDDYFFVNVPGTDEMDGTGNGSKEPSTQDNGAPLSPSSSYESELYYSPSLSPGSVQNDSSPAMVMQTPRKHDVEATPRKTPRANQGLARTPGKDAVQAYNSLSQANKSALEIKNESKWIYMLNNWGFTVMFRSGSLRRRLRRGIPAAVRPMAWYRLCDVSALRHRIEDPSQMDLLAAPKHVRDDIEKDIDRTYPEHELFATKGKGQEDLRDMLTWYSIHDPETEYCQGMSFVAGLLLTYFTKVEACYCFKHCLGTMGLRCMYLPGLVDLQRRQYVLMQLGWHHMEDLWQHLMDSGVQPMMYATEWFMTLFCRGFDFQLSTRVVEIFMYEGFKVLYRVALTILNSMRAELMEGSFEEILRTIRVRSRTLDPQAIMIDAYSWSFRSAEIEKYEKAYDDIQRDERK